MLPCCRSRAGRQPLGLVDGLGRATCSVPRVKQLPGGQGRDGNYHPRGDAEQRFAERASKSLIINAFEETYLLDLKEDHAGYNNVDIPGLFNHLCRHYGKITDESLETLERNYLKAIQELHMKAKGLEIERFLLPVGNDGLNSEGMSRATTKGTPQQDNMRWRQSFSMHGLWRCKRN